LTRNVLATKEIASDEFETSLIVESFYGAVRKLTFLKKLILILMFDSFLNC